MFKNSLLIEMDYIIKELTGEDLRKNKDSLFESLSRVRSVGEINSADACSILERINSQDAHIFVAMKGEGNSSEIIGTTTVLIEQKFIRGGAKVAHIEDVSTKKEFEGHGVAKAVMTEAMEYAKERGCYKVILDCSTETVGFYEKIGFKRNENHMRLDL